jgi:nitrite reductase (NADH) small subunit
MALVKVAEVNQVPPGTGKVVSAGEKVLALFNLNGTFYALDNRCTHMGGPLGEGQVEGNVVICPWHGSRFDITTGHVVKGPARQPVISYSIQVQSGAVYVDLS